MLEIRPTIKWDKGKALEFLLESLGKFHDHRCLNMYHITSHSSVTRKHALTMQVLPTARVQCLFISEMIAPTKMRSRYVEFNHEYGNSGFRRLCPSSLAAPINKRENPDMSLSGFAGQRTRVWNTCFEVSQRDKRLLFPWRAF